MGPRPRSRLVGVGLVAAGVAGAIALTTARGGSEPPIRPVAYANGILSTSTSGDGEAILSAADMAPGHSAHGSVTIRNDSSENASLSLEQRLRSETPGAGGGRLYDDLQLQISQSDGSRDGLVYTGPMAAIGPTDLAPFDASESRTYSFVVRMPDNGTADNALENAAVSVDYVWTANGLGQSGSHGCRHGMLRTDGPDSVYGTSRNDRILAMGGDDRIRGKAGSDCIYGGRGDDRLWGDAGNDRLRGGFGDDLLRGGAGNDRIRGRQGDDVVIGGSGKDSLRGTSGDDLIYAADGAPDRIRCGIGRDVAVVDSLDRVSGCETVRIR